MRAQDAYMKATDKKRFEPLLSKESGQEAAA